VAEAAARLCCCAHSRPSRASATSVSPSGDQPMRHFSMVGSRTELVRGDWAALVWWCQLCQLRRSKNESSSATGHLCGGPTLHLRPARLGRGNVLRCCVRVHGRAPDVGRLVRCRAATIVTIFAWSLGAFIAAMIVVTVGLLAGGPVGRFKVTASRDGASVEANQ